jgi:hypothetical protein
MAGKLGSKAPQEYQGMAKIMRFHQAAELENP